jgi:hypothetical protein
VKHEINICDEEYAVLQKVLMVHGRDTADWASLSPPLPSECRDLPRKRKNLGDQDASNLNARLAAYFAVKCGTHSVADLKGKALIQLIFCVALDIRY